MEHLIKGRIWDYIIFLGHDKYMKIIQRAIAMV
jgi:hypothetical protein